MRARRAHHGRDARRDDTRFATGRRSAARRRLVRLRAVGLAGTVAVAVVVAVLVAGRHGDVTAVRVSAESPSTATTAPADSVSVSPSSGDATAVCQARLAQYAGADNATHASLAAAYPSTAADIAADEEQRKGAGFRSAWRDRAAGEFEALCFFDADAFGIGPLRSGDTRPQGACNRLAEVIRPDGFVVVYTAGDQASLSVAPVSSASAG